MLDVMRIPRYYIFCAIASKTKYIVIVSFSYRRAKAFHTDQRVMAFSGLERTASRKLDQLDAATNLSDLARPGNRLKALNGQWSIRINDQWRICFKWPKGSPGPTEVEIVD